MNERPEKGRPSVFNTVYFLQTLDRMLEGVQIFDFEWNCVYANDTVIKNSGLNRKEFLKLKAFERFPGVEHTSLFTLLDNCMKERKAEHFNTSFVFPDGRKGHFELSILPVPEGMAILSIDRTEQERANEKLQKVNRLYSFLSAINKSIVHSVEEKELLNTACSIASRIGDFTMTWIDLLDSDTGRLSTISICGKKEATKIVPRYENEVYENNPIFRGTPVEHVLTSGEFLVSNDVPNDPIMTAWRKELIQNDIHSSIVFPIVKFGRTIGVFGFHSSIDNFFDEQEITLLQEALNDISFALEQFDKTKKHKETEELVLKNEKRFRTLIEKSTGMKTLTSAEGILLYGSPAVTNILGYAMEEFVGTPAASYLHPDDLPHLAENRAKLLEKPGQSFSFLYRFRHKDGHWIWCEGTLTNQLHDPAINAMVTNFNDVSEKKRLQDQREFDKSNLDALINNTKGLMWSIDRDYRLVTSNRAFDETMQMLIGKKVEKGELALDPKFPAENLERFREYYERALAGETFTVIDHATDPLEYWTEISYCPIFEGDKIVGAACYSHDITAIKKTEAQLKQSERNFKEAQEIAHLGSWKLDLRTRLAVWSEEACRIFGLPPEENKQPHDVWLTFVHPDDMEYVRYITSEAQKSLADIEFNHRIVLKDGTVKHIYMKSVFQFDEEGKPIGLNGVAHDVTELKKTEQYLRESEMFNRGVLNSLNSHIAVIDESGMIIAVNEAWMRFKEENGVTPLPRTRVRRNYYKVYEELAACGDELAAEALKGVKEVMEKKNFFYLEYPCHSEDEQRWFAMRATRFDSDEPMVVIAHENITKLKKAEEELDNNLVVLEQRVKERTQELTEKNLSVLDSINYAKRIQLGLLTRKSELYELFPRAFMLSCPRDIVSGDFFWCYQSHGKKFVVVADCTGHGVPGALLSIIGNSLLNRIIVDEHIENPSEILEQLDKRLTAAVKGDSQDIRDGMDIALCVIDTYFNELYFVGAYRPLFLSDENGRIVEMPANRQSIGGEAQEVKKKFETKRVAIIPGQRVYLTSDGYYSQFGGPDGKKFMKSRFMTVLESMQHLPIDHHEVELLNVLVEWMGENEQVDDVMIVGIEL
jgi:PAS domain S-box-containing protein